MLSQTKSTWRVFPPIPAREDCSICQGTGWELMRAGGASTARRCPCVALTRTARLKDQIGIPERYRHCTLENYHPGTLAQTRALAEAWRFVECFPNVDRGLIFVGGSGTGKTHLAVGIVLELAERFYEDSFFTDFRSLPGLHFSLGGTIVGGNPSGSRVRTVSLLALDNFGAGRATDNQYRAALRILHARMRARRPTLCTSPGPVVLDGAESRGPYPGTVCSASNCVIDQARAFILGGFKIVLMDGAEGRPQR